MTVRFLHSSDWQIGKVFRFVDGTTMGLLQEARLEAVTRLGKLAEERGVHHVLVAGDVYDMEVLSARSLNQPLERMRDFPGVQWHLLPGNHDPHRSNGLWDRLLRKDLPPNVRAHVEAKPFFLDEGAAVLLPAPLRHRHTFDDPTAYMDEEIGEAGLAEGQIRIGLAHGTVSGFGSDDRGNYVAPDRPERSELSYLALGDWHGQKRISDRCWYSGTPEIDAFDVVNGGWALLVEIEGQRAAPVVTSLTTGRYTWSRLSEKINNRKDIGFLVEKLRSIDGKLERLIDLKVEGALSLEDRRDFEEKIKEGLSAAFRFLRVDEQSLFSRPTVEDLDRIDRDGFVRKAAEELKRRTEEGSEEERSVADEALRRLYFEHMKLQVGQK